MLLSGVVVLVPTSERVIGDELLGLLVAFGDEVVEVLILGRPAEGFKPKSSMTRRSTLARAEKRR